MNKTCARCEKTVYPTEELKCLDKVWHKGCFKCQECGMTLNMRTYKGYGKLPYCEAHVPKAKPTTMAETPELKRIAENTKLQSNVNYHADFERSKGKFTQVADDPETLRIKANTKIISNVAYHGDLEKKAHMERQRQINENGELVDVPSDNYHQQLENYATEMLPPNQPPPHLPPKNHYQTPAPVTQYSANANQANRNYKQDNYKPDNYKQDNYKPEQYKNDQYAKQPEYQMPPEQFRNDAYQRVDHHQNNRPDAIQSRPDAHQSRPDAHQTRPDAYQSRPDALQNRPDSRPEAHQSRPDNHRPEALQSRPDQTRPEYSDQFYRQQRYEYEYQTQQQLPNKYEEYNQYAYGQYTTPQQYGVGSQQKIGRIQDYDPLSDGPRIPPNTQRASSTVVYNSDSKRGSHQPQQQQSRAIGRVTDLDPMANEQPRLPAPTNHHPPANQRVYIAMYDYEANDSDEVSFREGDLISNVSSVDAGWMTGQVLRTGRTGMLPANYVERAETAQH